MAKLKKNLQDIQVPVVQSTKTSIVKKRRNRRKKKDNIGSLNNIDKNNLKKPSNEIAKDIFTNKQNNKRKNTHGSKNKLKAKYTKNSDVSTKYAKDDKKTLRVSQKVQINADIETKKKRNKKRKLEEESKQIKEKFNKLQKIAIDLHKTKKLRVSPKKRNEKKMKQISTKVEAQQIQSDNTLKLNKHKININLLAKMFKNESKLKKKIAQPTTLRDRMIMQLRASRFRLINEKLYNNDSSMSKHYFQQNPDDFMGYHAGYKQQIEQWPINPLDVIISSIKKLPMDNIIADFGCGEARLAASVPHTVHSFDFIALNNKVKVCDMAHTPLLMNSVHVVVFCLSLMGSNLNDYIIEANRVLKNNGILKIAEVESRFVNIKNFIRTLRHYGFKNTWKDLSQNMFYFMDFKKKEDISMKRKNIPEIRLNPCVYKKR